MTDHNPTPHDAYDGRGSWRPPEDLPPPSPPGRPTALELERAIKEDGRYGAGAEGDCVAAPLGCGTRITPIVASLRVDGRAWDQPPEGKGPGFRDLVSLREWQITGLCQRCQDALPVTERREDEYDSIEAFYAAAEPPRRRFSREVDYGVQWTVGDVRWPRYRVSWVEASQEVIAVLQGGEGRSPVFVLGRTRNPDLTLEGWPEVCGAMGSLGWVLDRLIMAANLERGESPMGIPEVLEKVKEQRLRRGGLR